MCISYDCACNYRIKKVTVEWFCDRTGHNMFSFDKNITVLLPARAGKGMKENTEL
jgi:hypothetical protein